VGGLTIGALRPTNTWDLPTYLLIGGLAVVYACYRQHGQLSLAMIGEAGLKTVALLAIAVVAFLPFTDHFGAGYASFGLWPGSYTLVKNYLAIYGLFLFVVITHLWREFRDWTASWTPGGMARLEPAGKLLILALALYLVVLVILVIRDYWIGPMVLSLALLAGLLALRPSLSNERRVVLMLIAIALALTLFVEIFVLEGDIGRMNTVFKFYMQVWLMLSVVGGAALAWAWPTARRRWGYWPRRVWQGALAILVGCALLYPLLATQAKWQVRMNQAAPRTLDGMVFMKSTSYQELGQTISLDFDYEALQWMQRHIEGSPVIAEGYSHNQPGWSFYRSITNRVSMYTGLPSIVGWDWHQRQQRAVLPGNLVSDRVDDVNTLFNTSDIGLAWSILEQYNVKYVYVGQLEWVYYNPEGLNKFGTMVEQGLLREVYRNAGVSIYEVLTDNAQALGGPGVAP
jgi:YYY domain-containing protein